MVRPDVPLVVYVDVDDTLVRSVGAKRIPINGTVAHIRSLAGAGVEMYCWSTAGAEYARSTAVELGIVDCFVAFLPKPHVLIDDQEVGAWRRLVQVHPLQCNTQTVDAYRRAVHGESLLADSKG